MSAAQARIGDTLEIFYGAADRASEGAMAGHAYKRSVDDLDSSFTRELVRCQPSITSLASSWLNLGRTLSHYNFRATGKNVRILSSRERAHSQT